MFNRVHNVLLYFDVKADLVVCTQSLYVCSSGRPQDPGLPAGPPGGGSSGQHDQGDQGHHQGQEAVEDLFHLTRYCRTTVLFSIKYTFMG